MGGWVDPETMSADARYFLQQVRDYEAKKQQAKEDGMRAHILGEENHENEWASGRGLVRLHALFSSQ